MYLQSTGGLLEATGLDGSIEVIGKTMSLSPEFLLFHRLAWASLY